MLRNPEPDGGPSKQRLTVLPDIEAQKKGDEDTRDDDVTQTQHGEVSGFQPLLQQVLREDHWEGGRVTASNLRTSPRHYNLHADSRLHLIGASKDLATVTMTLVPNTWRQREQVYLKWAGTDLVHSRLEGDEKIIVHRVDVTEVQCLFFFSV